MPISLIALWFRQRAERQGVWALCAAVLQPGCHLGGWIPTLPLANFAFSFAIFQCETESSFSWGWGQEHLEEPVLLDEGFHQVYAHTCAWDRSVPMFGSSSPISFSVHKLEGLQHLSSEASHSVCPVQTPGALVGFFIGCWDFGDWTSEQKGQSKKKKKID